MGQQRLGFEPEMDELMTAAGFASASCGRSRPRRKRKGPALLIAWPQRTVGGPDFEITRKRRPK